MEDMSMDWGHCWKHTHYHFLVNSRVNMAGFVDPHKVVARKSAFSALLKCMKWKWKQKIKKTMKKEEEEERKDQMLT
jgi:hypothetical protein